MCKFTFDLNKMTKSQKLNLKIIRVTKKKKAKQAIVFY